MIIQQELYERIEKLINSKKTNKKNEDIVIILSKSKTTSSIYITVLSAYEEEKIRIKYRISDHHNSKVKTKVVRRATTFNFIERKLDSMIKRVRTIRYNRLVNSICTNDISKK
jgi:hypothetical protein